ncbi:D-alanyl-D-alanine carboxypeptidase/D-alanyl-D-alanine-endopeptidase [Streptomyces sp. NPDC048717]|uniref:D-alanyl-D-alanine carboxypeptidase/D-alanyl-D-alanine endopeptidase n=1 Tax=Streptomyces sp. NPDC048717 TaxID=3154928 RepID=UPI0034219A9F
MPDSRTWQVVAGSAALGLALAVGAVTASGPWDSGQRKAERDRAVTGGVRGGAHHSGDRAAADPHRPAPAPSAPAVLGALTAAGGPGSHGNAPSSTITRPGDDPAALAAALTPLLADPGLGPLRTATVVDATTGKRLYGEGASTPMTPASTIKIATTAAALSALGPRHRIATTTVAGPDGRTVTLVGGGDPTLDRARLKALAEATARAVKAPGARAPGAAGSGTAASGTAGAGAPESVRLAYDTSLYQGPVLHPIGPNENISPVTALMTDEGRLDHSHHGPAPRSADPAGDTATAFAGLLEEAGLTVQGDPRPAKAPKGARPLARTDSASLDDLVERTLTHSDNDLAEALARQTALAHHRPASFAGAERAVHDELGRLGLPLAGTRFADGSGLDRADRVTGALLTGVLTRAADPARPTLRTVLTGLPVGGFSGTLAGRFGTTAGSAAEGAGLVRAKTGTLTGVNTLAGTVVTADGRLLAFAFLTGRTSAPDAAQSALDRLAAVLTRPVGVAAGPAKKRH